MDMTGKQHIKARRERVWEALNDAAVLKQCIPGCEEIEAISPTEFKAKITVRVATLKATLSGNVTLSDIDPARAYVISGMGSGGIAGFAQGSARVNLEDIEDGTLLLYEVKAALGGRLALGAKVIDSTAKRLAVEFFNNLNRALDPSGPK